MGEWRRDVVVDDERKLSIIVGEEGIIIDLIVDDVVTESMAMMFDEWADYIEENGVR